MKGQGPSENLERDGLRTPKRTSPFVLLSIFFALSISEHPPFIGNNPLPGDSHAQVGGEGFGMKR